MIDEELDRPKAESTCLERFGNHSLLVTPQNKQNQAGFWTNSNCWLSSCTDAVLIIVVSYKIHIIQNLKAIPTTPIWEWNATSLDRDNEIKRQLLFRWWQRSIIIQVGKYGHLELNEIFKCLGKKKRFR